MSININSEAACRKAYLNYHCYGNTMGISAKEMGEITQAWSDKLSSWQATVSSDENEYEFDDSDYSSYKENGEEAAKKTTDYDGKTGGQITRGIADLGAGVGGAVYNIATGGAKSLGNLKNITKLGKGTMTEGAKNAATTTTTTTIGTGKNAKTITETKTKASVYVQAALAIATAGIYWASKPNKDAKEACDDLQTEMSGAQATLGETQSNMDDMADELTTLSDEALAKNENANDEIEEQKSEYDMYYESLIALKEKIDSGEPLTDSEKELYKEVIGYLSEIGVSIEELSEDTTDEVSDLYDEMGSYQDGYDEVAETMGEIEGLTDYAEGFDETTRTMCYLETVSQGANAASGAMAGAKLMGMGFWNWALGAASIAAGVSSVAAAAQQLDWAGKVGTEIDMRKETQSLNSETMDKYEEEIDAYDGWMQGVEDLELEIPDDIEPVEDTGLPTEEPTGEDAVPETLKPKKDEEEEG